MHLFTLANQCSICQKSSGGRALKAPREEGCGERASSSPPGEGPGEGVVPPPQKFFFFISK